MSNRILRYSLYTFIALTAFGAGLWMSGSRQAGAPEVTASEALLALALPDLQGKPQRLDQWRGKVLVVNFWATWCAPCREEIPIFVKMQEKYGAKGLQFVGISIDQVDKTQEFARNFSINYPNLIGTIDTVEISRQAGNKRRVLPYTIILDRKGEIAVTEMGGLTQEKLESIVKSLL
ncbi:MAG: TlpA disulfide reductase family protein [Burkholderiales bacterium]